MSRTSRTPNLPRITSRKRCLCRVRCIAVSESETSTMSTPSTTARARVKRFSCEPATCGHTSTACARRNPRCMPPRRNTRARTSDTCDSCRAMGTPVRSFNRPDQPCVDLEEAVETLRRLAAGDDRLPGHPDEVEEVIAPGRIKLGREIVQEEHRRFGVPLLEQLEFGHPQRQGDRAGLATAGVRLGRVAVQLQGEVAAVWTGHRRTPGALLLPGGMQGGQQLPLEGAEQAHLQLLLPTGYRRMGLPGEGRDPAEGALPQLLDLLAVLRERLGPHVQRLPGETRLQGRVALFQYLGVGTVRSEERRVGQ